MGEARFRAFGVGCAKTGTNSLARMFAGRYRSEHEPAKHALMQLIVDRARMSEDAFRDAVRATLAPLELEMNASQLNGYIVDTMVALYPRAKFILTLREPKSWVRSFVNHQKTRGALARDSLWARFRDMRFLAPGETSDGNGLYTIDQYLSYWLAHNAAVMRAVPAAQLLVVRTDSLNEAIPRLAAFLGVPQDTIAPAHANEGAYAEDARIDARELDAAAAEYAKRLFEITGLDVR